MYFFADIIKKIYQNRFLYTQLNTIFFTRYFMIFTTLNESSLHHTLKILYQELYEGEIEVKKDGYVYDIITKKGNIIEIQTKNLSKLLPKILATIKNGRNIKLVHPIVISKIIETKDKNGNIISKRKSSKKGCIYDIFNELTGIYSVLLNPKFSLEIVEIQMTEERELQEKPVQSQNKKRRFRQNWLKTNKRLENIINTRRFSNAYDYISLLPELPKEFCASDLKNTLEKNKDIPKRISKNPHIILWVLNHIELIEKTEKKGRSIYYKICKEKIIRSKNATNTNI